jgi:hypothetical protein
MPRKLLTISEESQEIKENGLLEDYTYEPKQVRSFFISNILQRVFAHLIGWSEDGARKLRCTTAGELKVATVGAGYEHNTTSTGNAPDTYGTAIDFGLNCSRVDIAVFNNSMILKRSTDGVTYDSEIEIPANSFYSFDCVTRYFNIKNKTALSVARYQVTGWY